MLPSGRPAHCFGCSPGSWWLPVVALAEAWRLVVPRHCPRVLREPTAALLAALGVVFAACGASWVVTLAWRGSPVEAALLTDCVVTMYARGAAVSCVCCSTPRSTYLSALQVVAALFRLRLLGCQLSCSWLSA